MTGWDNGNNKLLYKQVSGSITGHSLFRFRIVAFRWNGNSWKINCGGGCGTCTWYAAVQVKVQA